MKIINRKNFFPSVCIAYTLISLGKIGIEYLFQGKFGNDPRNYISIFIISCAVTLVLSQHYRLQKFPFLLVVTGQYVVVMGCVLLAAWISSQYEPMHPNGYWYLFRSVTVPYVIGAAIYYIEVFHEIRKANTLLQQLDEAAITEPPTRQKGRTDESN